MEAKWQRCQDQKLCFSETILFPRIYEMEYLFELFKRINIIFQMKIPDIDLFLKLSYIFLHGNDILC